ncbi:hypothetical protein MW887_003203 [Aspergillus wentii]|nr:hypothetical protein MW887_003203 [Aspergillus wentii]
MSEQETVQLSPQDSGRNLQLHGPPWGLEKIYDYETGGHHPIHLGDRLGNDGKYRVIHKLGSGGFANVWLCQALDPTPKYVALKIIMADFSGDNCPELKVNKVRQLNICNDSICLPLDQFKITGPNGEHWCFVYPLAGPAVSSINHIFEDHDKTLRRIALHTVEAMASLHEHGICHGDFTPHNVLLRVTGLDGLSEEEVIKILGEPKTFKVTTCAGEIPPETAAKYLVIPVEFEHVDVSFLRDEVYVIDFELGTPKSYSAPEILLGEKPGPGSDIWALACTLFSIRTGRKLFTMFDDDADEYLYFMALFFGIMPEPWWSTTWEHRRRCFEDEPDSEGRPVIKGSTDEARGFEKRVEAGFEYEVQSGGKFETVHRDIPPEEVMLFVDLLMKLFRFKPEERLSARDAQDHEWFDLGI